MDIEKYRKQIEELQSFPTQSPNGLVINRFISKNSKTDCDNVLAASKNYTYDQLQIIASRWNELVSIMCSARYYLLESVRESYSNQIYDSVESTRLMHLYTACMWYNSITDSILQFYYLVEHAHEVNDDNYKDKLKDKKHKRNAQIRRSCIPRDDLSQFESLEKKLHTIRDIANTIKHRRVSLLPEDKKDKHSIGVIQIDGINENGMPHVVNGSKSLSGKKLQAPFIDFENQLNEVLKIDKNEIVDYLNLLQKKFFAIMNN